MTSSKVRLEQIADSDNLARRSCAPPAENSIAPKCGRRRRDPARFDLAALASARNGFSGAEIEQVVNAGLFLAFDAGRDLGFARRRSAPNSLSPAAAASFVRRRSRFQPSLDNSLERSVAAMTVSLMRPRKSRAAMRCSPAKVVPLGEVT